MNRAKIIGKRHTQQVITLVAECKRRLQELKEYDTPRIPPFGTSSTSTNPLFTNQQYDSHDRAVCNEATTHNIMGKTLT